MKQPCVYILASGPYGTLYIGVTSDLLARIYQHRTGTVDGFTKQYAVHHLVRFELFEDMFSAIAREKQLKRWHRQWKVHLMRVRTRNGLIWPRVSDSCRYRRPELVSGPIFPTAPSFTLMDAETSSA